VDLVFLASDPDLYLKGFDWVRELGAEILATESWGAITSVRLRTATGTEVELGIGDPSWASIDPIDAGTERVIRGGCRVLDDPYGSFARLIAHIETDRETSQ
jgi:hypothetical protein